jgi:hypothetical protein
MYTTTNPTSMTTSSTNDVGIASGNGEYKLLMIFVATMDWAA